MPPPWRRGAAGLPQILNEHQVVTFVVNLAIQNGATIRRNRKTHSNRLVNGGYLPGLIVGEAKELNGGSQVIRGVRDEVNSITNGRECAPVSKRFQNLSLIAAGASFGQRNSPEGGGSERITFE